MPEIIAGFIAIGSEYSELFGAAFVFSLALGVVRFIIIEVKGAGR